MKPSLTVVSNTTDTTATSSTTVTPAKATPKKTRKPAAAKTAVESEVTHTVDTTEEVKTGGGKGGGEGPNDPLFSRSEIRGAIKSLVQFGVPILGIMLLCWAAVTTNGKIKEVVDAPPVVKPADVIIPKVQPTVVSAPVTPRNTVVYGSFFDCSTISGKDANVRNAVIQHVNAGQSLHIPQSCALVHMDTVVSEFNARKYKLWVSLLNISGNEYKSDTDIYNPYDTCGDTNGNNDRIPQCIDFINRYSKEGKDILVVIEHGGFVNIN